ncbi:MAG: M14 family metallopeptidase [bacterium]|nr:M14 family metallopeptidase [Candidatus Limimorpha equi]
MKKYLSFLLILFVLASCGKKEMEPTTFEKSEFLETDNYEGTIDYAQKLAKCFKQVNYEVIGKSGAGRDIPMLIVDENGYTKPEKIHKQGKAIVWVESCIHPGEPNGKDAMFMMIRDMLVNGTNANLLKNISIVFLPVVSPDGLANFSPYNRINQNGPKQMGWRVTAQGLNLNRDFTKLDSPELRALVNIFNQWQPDIFFDTHATDGADYQYVTTYSIEDFGNYDHALSFWLSEAWEKRIVTAMARHDMPVTRYIEFNPWGDPTAALSENSFSAMFSESYAMARNCPGILLETHMLKPYKDRVFSTYYMILETMKIINEDKDGFLEVIAKARQNDLEMKELPINLHPSYQDTLWVDFLGYKFDTIQSDLTGGWYYSYDLTQPETRKVMKFRDDEPQKTLQVPKEYIIPAQYDKVIDIVKAHGFEIEYLKKEKTITANTYRFKNVEFYQMPYEGRSRICRFNTEEISKEMTFPKGSAVVKTSQNGIRLLMNLLEPEMQGSLFEWGFFNTVLQRVEYFEIYKMEPFARQMLVEDPFLQNQFDDWMASFPETEKPSQYAIMNWFYEQSPYFDKNYMIYPIGIVR